MTPLEILRDRFGVLRRRLDRLEIGLGSAALDWSQKEFANSIADRRCELNQQYAGTSASNLAWHAWAGQERACKPLFTEALAWLQAQGRPALEPTGPAMLARALVRDLKTECGLGIVPVIAPDVDDSFSDFVQIIRIRFPPGDIWDVPVVAHEFGHFAAFYLNARSTGGGPVRQNAFSEFVNTQLANKSQQQRQALTYRLNEFFADVFATYTVGPAFAMSALLLRFDVAQAYNESDPLHPSYAVRAAAILETMQRLSCGDEEFAKVTNWLGERWYELLEAAESKTEIGEVKGIAADLMAIMSSIARNGRYQGWPAKIALLQPAFMESKPVTTELSPRDLLNAAWMARTYGVEQLKVADRAQELWQQHCHA